MNALLVGMIGGGGEEVFVRELAAHPPPGLRYYLALRPHESVSGARARRLAEVAFNRLVQPWMWPLPGLKAYRVDRTIDLVHIHNYPHVVSSPHRAPVVMSLGGGSYYHYIQDYLGWPEQRIKRLYDRAATIYRLLGITNEFVTPKRLRGIFVRSAFARSFLLRAGVREQLVEVIPPGFETPPLPTRNWQSRPFTFLFVGRDSQRKGGDLVVEAIQRLRAQGRQVQLILVGDPRWKPLASEAGFEIHDWVARRRLYDDFYPRAQALLLPSRVEGFGLSAVEAMSFGLPVVATRYGALPEIVVDGETGLLVPPGDGRALERAMESLADDAAGARQMGTAGRARFEAEYSRPLFHRRLTAFYGRALGA